MVAAAAEAAFARELSHDPTRTDELEALKKEEEEEEEDGRRSRP